MLVHVIFVYNISIIIFEFCMQYILCVLLCSAGVGRTGTLITIQSMMKMIEREKKVDIFNFVLGMRCQRNLMVQTEVYWLIMIIMMYSYVYNYADKQSTAC